MLDSKGFDSWCKEYDQSVSQSEESNSYPFAGYNAVLSKIYRTVVAKPGCTVLDIGFGTAVLTQCLYESGCIVTGIDFSQNMVNTAQQKMPRATLYCHDFTLGLPTALKGKKFDFIISTYAIHHLDDTQKLEFLELLVAHLTPKGQILIGDVAFASHAEHDRCREQCGESWDSDEYYMVADKMKIQLPNLCFESTSFCSGIISLKPF